MLRRLVVILSFVSCGGPLEIEPLAVHPVKVWVKPTRPPGPHHPPPAVACAIFPDFICVDFCGSDAHVLPVCADDVWTCPEETFSSALCPAGTCFSEPGDLCANPRCVDGSWQCDAPDGGVHDPV